MAAASAAAAVAGPAEEEMIDYKSEIKEAMDAIETSNAFAVQGTFGPNVRPHVTVRGVGEIEYPISAEQARALIAVSEQAPFGHGTATVLDPEVRRAWQIDKTMVDIAEDEWDGTFAKCLTNAALALGISDEIEAHLYKLLIYEEGGHFKKHRDTEKEPNMFGTMVVALPSAHEGGELVVTHVNGRGGEKGVRFATGGPSSGDASLGFKYAAFYGDCEHMLARVTQGVRVVLVYNLVMAERREGQPLPTSTSRDIALVTAISHWTSSPHPRLQLAAPLEHKYTQANLSFENLKGRDAVVARTLRRLRDPATGDKMLNVYLCLVERHVVSSVSENYDYHYDGSRYKRRREDHFDDEGDDDEDDEDDESDLQHSEPDYEIEDTIDESTEVIKCVGSKPTSSKRINLNVHEDMVDDTESLFGSDPVQEDFEGYTGNEGATLEQWFHAAVIVLVPRHLPIGMVMRADMARAVQLLGHLKKSKSPCFESSMKEVIDHISGPLWTSARNHEQLTLNLLSLAADSVPLTLGTLRCITGTATRAPPLQVLQSPSHTVDREKWTALIASLVARVVELGWDSLGPAIMDLVAYCSSVTPHSSIAFVARLALALHTAQVSSAAVDAVAGAVVLYVFMGNHEPLTCEAIGLMLFTLPSALPALQSFVTNAPSHYPLPELLELVGKLTPTMIMGRAEDEVRAALVQLLTGMARIQPPSAASVNYSATTLSFAEQFILLVLQWEALLPALAPCNLLAHYVRMLCAANLKMLFCPLLEVPAIRAALQQGHEGLQLLCRERLAIIETAPPVYSPAMPHASFPSNAVVDQFLRSTKETERIQGRFRSITDARRLAQSVNMANLSCRAVEGGRASSSFVTLTKTRDHYNKLLAEYQRGQVEVKRLQSDLKACTRALAARQQGAGAAGGAADVGAGAGAGAGAAEDDVVFVG